MARSTVRGTTEAGSSQTPRSRAHSNGHGLSVATFLGAVEAHLGKRVDDEQRRCIEAPATDSLFLVAGPGTGKTTAVTLRILRLIFVEATDPAAILATTFTNRAADELRSRVLGWGTRLKDSLSEAGRLPPDLADLDINRILTGTLDSIAEQALTEHRMPGTPPPVLIQQFAADALMTHSGLLEQGRFNSGSLRQHALDLNGSTGYNFGFRELRAFCSTARQRLAQDRVSLQTYEDREGRGNRGAQRLCEVLEDYLSALQKELSVDFTGLEEVFLERIDGGTIGGFTDPLQAVFVDEYQDTNYLQESIYFALLRTVLPRSGSLTVVGDDDQSLYRFRAATVDLFQDFQRRCHIAAGVAPPIIYLRNNYRSTSNIVELCNAFVALDPDYAPARVAGKPPLLASRPHDEYTNYPVLGLFRPDRQTLARDIASTLDAIFNGAGFQIPGTRQPIRRHRGGSIADCALLCGSPRERDYKGRPRLPLLLRDQLSGLAQPLHVFNPRGVAFHLVPEVEQLGGLLLECLDPGSSIQNSLRLPRDLVPVLDAWRTAADSLIAADPPPHRPNRLRDFVRDWQRRRPSGGGNWPDEVPVAELLYKLACWIPKLVSDVEGLVYLEVFARTIAEATRIVPPIVTSDQRFATGRIKRLIREILAPLALGAIDVDEALLETLPGNHLSLFSVHQAKGLEFPMVIADIGSDFPDNRPAPFRRYPRAPGAPHIMEDHFRQYSTLAPPTRPGLDRAFDDLVRQYFVAYSRPKDVLMIVGLGDAVDGPIQRVKNVASGWTREEAVGCRWSELPHVILV